MVADILPLFRCHCHHVQLFTFQKERKCAIVHFSPSPLSLFSRFLKRKKDQKRAIFDFFSLFSPRPTQPFDLQWKPRDAFVDHPFFFRPRKSAALLILIFFWFFLHTAICGLSIISLLFHYLFCNNDRNQVCLEPCIVRGRNIISRKKVKENMRE